MSESRNSDYDILQASVTDIKNHFSFNDTTPYLSLSADYVDDGAPASAVGARIIAGYMVAVAGLAERTVLSKESAVIYDFATLVEKIRVFIDGIPELFGEEDSRRVLGLLSPLEAFVRETRDAETLSVSFETYLSELPSCFEDGKKGAISAVNKKAGFKKRSLKYFLKSADFADSFGEIGNILKEYYADYEGREYVTMTDFAQQRILNAYCELLFFTDDNKKIDGEGIDRFKALSDKTYYSVDGLASFAGMRKRNKTLEKLLNLRDILRFYGDMKSQSDVLQSLSQDASGGELAVFASVMTVLGALRDELSEEIYDIYKDMRKKDKLFEMKKKYIRMYGSEADAEAE